MEIKDRRDPMRRVVGKLLALALHEKTPTHEAETAMQRATEIKAKYNISKYEAMLKSTTHMEDTMIEEQVEMYYSYRTQNWEAQLGKVIGDAFDCRTILLRKKLHSGNNDCLTFLGNDSDIANVMYFFDYLQMLIAGEARQQFDLVSDRNSFALGAAERIGERLEDLYKRIEKIMPSDCTALVVIKKDAVSTFVKEKYPYLKSSGKCRAIRNHNAYRKGQKYGNSVSLSKGIGGEPRQQLTG